MENSTQRMTSRTRDLMFRARRGVYGLRRLCDAYFAQNDPPSVVRFFASSLVSREARARSFDMLDAVRADRDRATLETFEFIRDHLGGVPLASSRWEVLDLALRGVTLDGFYAEFGVADGGSLRFICQHVPGPVYGFDSFQGLPGDWGRGSWHGTFARPRGTAPAVPRNAVVVPGYFHESLPGFVQGIRGRPAAFLHMDADLYSSTSEVLSGLRGNILPSTILVFDEFLGHVAWKTGGEFRAFSEFIESTGYRFQYLSCNPAGGQVAVRILPTGSPP